MPDVDPDAVNRAFWNAVTASREARQSISDYEAAHQVMFDALAAAQIAVKKADEATAALARLAPDTQVFTAKPGLFRYFAHQDSLLAGAKGVWRSVELIRPAHVGSPLPDAPATPAEENQ